MKIVIAPDKFKDALDARMVCDAIEKGIKSFNPDIETMKFPMADGGNGTASLLTWHNKGEMVTTEVKNPLGKTITAQYGLSADKKTAYIEMAAASGIELLKEDERNPRKTSTEGTGMLINDAVEKGVQEIILGIGGSATNDAGTGMAYALGFRFFDIAGNPVKPMGENLAKIKQIKNPGHYNMLKDIRVTVASDVNNPLYGENGAAHVYAPQKGADKKDVQLLDDGLKNIATVFKKHFDKDLGKKPGAGAAGGLGAGAIVFLDATLKPGTELFMQAANFDEILEGTQLIITGEGKIDSQSLQGKVIDGLCRKAQEKAIPVAALCGSLKLTTDELKKSRLVYAASIMREPASLEKAIKQTAPALEMAAHQLVSLFSAGIVRK